jgi:hypothetical protein
VPEKRWKIQQTNDKALMELFVPGGMSGKTHWKVTLVNTGKRIFK